MAEITAFSISNLAGNHGSLIPYPDYGNCVFHLYDIWEIRILERATVTWLLTQNVVSMSYSSDNGLNSAEFDIPEKCQNIQSDHWNLSSLFIYSVWSIPVIVPNMSKYTAEVLETSFNI